MPQGLYLIVSGPSGVGKDTVVRRLGDSVYCSISATTRAPRGDDIPDVTYRFLTTPAFKKLIAEEGFLEYARYNGKYYGTPKAPAIEHYEKGETVVFVIDVEGGKQIKKAFPDAVSVFIAAPSFEVLEKRLRSRNTDSEESIQKRLGFCRREYEEGKKYDYIIVNDKLDQAVEALRSVITAEYCKAKRNLSYLEEL